MPVVPTPKVNPSRTWLEYCSATAAELDTAEVTKTWMLEYLLLQKAARKGSSYPVLFQELRAFWQHLADAELIPKSPMAAIPMPRNPEEEEVPVLEPEQIVALRAGCSGTGYWSACDLAILVVLYQTGLRRAELSALNWADVDLAEGLLIVRHVEGDKFRIAPLQPHSHQALLGGWCVSGTGRRCRRTSARGRASGTSATCRTPRTSVADAQLGQGKSNQLHLQ